MFLYSELEEYMVNRHGTADNSKSANEKAVNRLSSALGPDLMDAWAQKIYQQA